MDHRRLTYDLCRSYLSDSRSTLPEELYLKLHGLIRGRVLAQLADCTSLADPNIVGLAGWQTLLQVEAFFKKNKSFSDADACLAAAMSSFERGERKCRITNRRIDFYFFHPDRLDPAMRKYWSRMERELDSLLGAPADFLRQLPHLVRLTAGATSTKSRRKALPHLRISKRPYCSPRAVPYLQALSQCFGYGAVRPRATLANRVEFVSKNWKTDRTIACEPEGNMILQLAFDTYAKRRLRKYMKINLRTQSRNQVLARDGSISGNYATVDLSMASDTVSLETVAALLPSKWFKFLSDVRSPRSRGAIEVDYAKFSSMGNGSTFTIETMIFGAACRAVGSKLNCVYGDDIVIETELVPELMRVLRFFGFIPNTRKTHVAGPYRESCGAHWYAGSLVTPAYVRELDDRKAVMCHLANSLMAVAIPGGELMGRLVRLVSDLSLPLVPYNESTVSGVWVDTPTARRLKLIRSYFATKTGRSRFTPCYKSYQPVAHVGKVFDSRALFLWHLDALGRDTKADLANDFICRTRYTISSHRYRRKWVHWYDGTSSPKRELAVPSRDGTRLPVAGAPLQLYCWSDQLTAYLKR